MKNEKNVEKWSTHFDEYGFWVSTEDRQTVIADIKNENGMNVRGKGDMTVEVLRRGELIKTAPETLETLKQITRLAEWANSGGNMAISMQDILVIARAAVAKATGREDGQPTPRPTKEEEYRAALETIAYPRRGTPEEDWTAVQIGEYAQRVLEGEATPK